MKDFPLPVVAEAGVLQKALGLEPIQRTSTHSFPKGKVTIRTRILPTPETFGAVGVYYTNKRGNRIVCDITPTFSWQPNPNPNSPGWARTTNKDAFYSFSSGLVLREDFDSFVQTVKMLDDLIEVKMRGGVSIYGGVA
ncbi:MAG: hypothetical protein EBT75_07305 [Proteobacteria bacterium]|nr:hypothetical protein [Pseudomonadota bacterium]